MMGSGNELGGSTKGSGSGRSEVSEETGAEADGTLRAIRQRWCPASIPAAMYSDPRCDWIWKEGAGVGGGLDGQYF